jgi:hypothetical protein
MDKLEAQRETMAIRSGDVQEFQRQSRFEALKDMPTAERNELQAEIDSLWNEIPADKRARADALRRGL